MTGPHLHLPCNPHSLSKRITGRLAALVAALAVAACGGSSDSPPVVAAAPAAKVFTAEIGGCVADEGNFRDSGVVVYVTIPADCAPTFPAELKVDYLYKKSREVISSLTQTVQALDAPVQVQLPDVGTREISVFHRGQWRSMANTDSWAPRDGAGLLELNGRLYLLGGWLHGPVTNEVWVTDDLQSWTFLGHAPWPGRHGAGWLVHDGRMWVISGDLIQDVWSSADGINWVEENASPPFGKRYGPSVVAHDGYMYLYGGQYWAPDDWCLSLLTCVAVGLNDVWRSANGRDWELVAHSAPWGPRALVHGGLEFDGQIFVVGGGMKGPRADGLGSETVMEYTDIWSSPDGTNWTKRFDKFAFPSRTHFSVLSTTKGCYVSDGSVGVQDNVSNDMYFAPDCMNYTQIPDTPFQPRHASSLSEFNGSLVLLGGPVPGDAGTTVWQYFP